MVFPAWSSRLDPIALKLSRSLERDVDGWRGSIAPQCVATLAELLRQAPDQDAQQRARCVRMILTESCQAVSDGDLNVQRSAAFDRLVRKILAKLDEARRPRRRDVAISHWFG